MSTSTALPLPKPDEIAITDYAIGLARSDLDHLVTVLEGQTATISVEEALEKIKRGEQFDETARIDRDALARIVVFAADA